MEIPALITAGYRKLLNTKEYKQITITDICKEAGISRKTFYNYYASKQEVTRAFLHEDMITPTETLAKILPGGDLKSTPKLMLEQTYKTMIDNKKAYESLLLHLGMEEFAQLMIGEITAFMRPKFAEYDLEPDECEYGAYFIAASQTMIKIRWIENGMDIPPNRMASLCLNWLFAHWREMAEEDQIGLSNSFTSKK